MPARHPALHTRRYEDLILNTAGLISHWCLDEAGGVPRDRKGTNHGAYIGTVPKAQQGPFQQARSIKTSGSSFDGVEVPDANSLDYGDGPVTYETWYRLTSDPGTYTSLFYKGSSGIHMTWNGTGSTDRWEGWTGGNWIVANVPTPALSGWHLIHMEKQADIVRKIFIDAVDVSGSTATSAAVNNASVFSIGAGFYGFPGFVSEASIYGVILTPGQIAERWNLAMGR